MLLFREQLWIYKNKQINTVAFSDIATDNEAE